MTTQILPKGAVTVHSGPVGEVLQSGLACDKNHHPELHQHSGISHAAHGPIA